MKSEEQLLMEIKGFFDQVEHLSDKWDDAASEEFKEVVMTNTEIVALSYTQALSVLSHDFSHYVHAAEQLLNWKSGISLINWAFHPLSTAKMAFHRGVSRVLTGRDYHFRK